MSVKFMPRPTNVPRIIVYDGTKEVGGRTYYKQINQIYGNITWYDDQGNIVPEPTPSEIPYFTITTEGGRDSITISPAEEWDATIKEYSTDGGQSWSTYTSGDITGTTIKIRGTGGTRGSLNQSWTVTPEDIDCVLSGNTETILDYQKVARGEHPEIWTMSFARMFEDCSAIKSIKNLVLGSSTSVLETACYRDMFRYCPRLIDLPSLPALTLARDCYEGMFNSCESLMVSETKSGDYKVEFRIPSAGTGVIATGALNNMFLNTGGEFTETPDINKTYYLASSN